MKIFEHKGYTYKKHISTGGQGEIHLLERDGHFFIAKIFPNIDADNFILLKHIQEIHAPNVPEIYDVYNHKDKTILIRDYIQGHTLYEEIKKNGVMALERALFIILKVCETLKTFHNIKPNPIIYRDLKPENIMVSDDGNIFLIDFGISRYHKDESIRDTVLAGTRGYTAPEVMAGMQSDNRSDIYSVGLIFYEMLTGKNLLLTPFQIRPVKESNESIPKRVDKVIAKATNLNIAMRYHDINELSEVLEKSAKRGNWILRKFLYVAALILVITALIFGIQYLNRSRIQEPTDNLYDIFADLTFDNIEDFSRMELVGQKIESGEIQEADFPSLIQNSVYSLKCQTIMNNKLNHGTFFHTRIRPGEIDMPGPLFFLSILPQIDNIAAYNILFTNREVLRSEIVNEYGYFSKEAKGFPIIAEHRWMDIIVYLDETGEILRYFVFDTEDEEHISYGGIRVLDEWIGSDYSIELNIPFEYWENEMGIVAPITEVELARFGSGSFIGYLSDNIPAYHRFQDQIREFLDQDIEYISQDQFTEHGY